MAAATARCRRGCSGSPSELFAPATAAQHKLRRSWKRPAPAGRSRRAERSRKDCERHARRRAERPSFGASVGRGLRRRGAPLTAAAEPPALPPTTNCGEDTEREATRTPRETGH